MKTRTFEANATSFSYQMLKFELTEDEYQAAIKKYGCIEQYVDEYEGVTGFRELPNGGDWEFGDVNEITEENTNV